MYDRFCKSLLNQSSVVNYESFVPYSNDEHATPEHCFPGWACDV